MHAEVQPLHDKLTELAAQLSGADDRLITEIAGWHYPALTNRQISRWLLDLAASLAADPGWTPTDAESMILAELRRTAEAMRSQLVPGLLNGNVPHSVVPVMATLSYMSNEVNRLLGWKPARSSILPATLTRRLQRIESELDNIAPDMASIQDRLEVVNKAYERADQLPTTLQELKSARTQLQSVTTSSAESLGQVKGDATAVKIIHTELKELRKEAHAIVQQCADAYSITTTIGLAKSFDDRARSLETSVYIWVGGLAVALGLGMLVGWWRLDALKNLLDKPNVDTTHITVQLLLSLLSVGAPVWFAWMATKQIGQRFRLAEDYAYKASVAKAYEGYRREAVRLDKNLEKALFASALGRLDEAPLRLVEATTPGSPIHELTTSELVKDFFSRALGIAEGVVKSKDKSTKQAAE